MPLQLAFFEILRFLPDNSMKSKALLAACILTLGLSIGMAQPNQPEIGQPAPEFTLTDIDGQTHSLADFHGKTVVIEWVNPDCPFVRKHYESGNIPALQKQAVADGVVWLLINSGHAGAQGDFDQEQVRAWQLETGAVATAYFRDRDGTVGRLYRAKTTPHMFIVNPDGILVYNGAIDSIRSASKADIARAENYVTSALAAIARGEEVSTPLSQPYGCSVKY
jgi:catechol 2,3-dioxygenase-like lactoylglutathione lyase family enzyme